MEASDGGGATLIRAQSAQERQRASQAQADQDQADAQSAAIQLEIDHVRAKIAAEAKSVPAATVLQAHYADHAQAAISTGRLVSVVCEGWAIAAAPLAKDNLRAQLLPPTAEQRARDRRNTAVKVALTTFAVLAGDPTPANVGSQRLADLAAARQAAAGKVVYKLRVTFASGHQHLVYRRWSELEAMVKSQRRAASYGAVREAPATLPLKYKNPAKYDTATGALACDGARLSKRTRQMNTTLAALCACTELVGHIDGGGAQTSAAQPFADFIAEDRGLVLPTGMASYGGTPIEIVSQRLVPSTLQPHP